MIPIISIAILAVVMGVTYVLLRLEIARLRRGAYALRDATFESFKEMSGELDRVSDFLDQWIPVTEHAVKIAARQDALGLGPHIHWYVDRLAIISRCRCGETVEEL